MKALKKLNDMISTADPDNYSNVSHNKYYRDLTTISNLLLEDQAIKIDIEKKLLLEILNLPDSETRLKLINLISQL